MECTKQFGAITVFAHVRFAFWKGVGRGGASASSERDQKLLQMLGLYVSQQCQYALVPVKALPEEFKETRIFYNLKID